MKKSLKIAMAAALLAARPAVGATSATQEAQTVNLALTATVQTQSSPAGSTCANASLATKDVVAALGKAAGTAFSASAQLVLIGNANGSTNNPAFYVREVLNGTNVNTLVNGNVAMSTLGAVVKSATADGSPTTGSRYEVGLLRVQTPALNLSFYTYGTRTAGTGALTASGVGAGMVGANPAIFKGALTFSAFQAR